MIGKPKYKINDKVKFYFDNGNNKTLMNGEIRIVDAYGCDKIERLRSKMIWAIE